MTKERLKNYKWIAAGIRLDKARLETLEAKEEGKAVSYDGVCVSSGIGNPTASLACKIAEIKQRIERGEKQLAEIETEVEQINDIMIKIAIRSFYIDNIEWPEISKELGLTVSAIQKNINKYLE